jgi:hypothetical protein
VARKVETITIDTPGRDMGKVFELTEMPATKAEKWAARALLALLRSGIEIPEDVASAGLAGVAAMGLKAFGGISFADAEPLLDEMMGCITVIPDPNRPFVKRPIRSDDDIEEVGTLLRLREEVLSLHLGFSISAYRSKSMAANQTVRPTLNTETSAAPSEQ